MKRFYLRLPPLEGGVERKVGTLKPSLLLLLPMFLFNSVVTLLVFLFLDYGLSFLQYHLYALFGVFFDYDSWYFFIVLGVCLVLFLPVVWKMAVLITTSYEFTTRRLFYTRGVFSPERDQLELVRVRDVGRVKPFFLRIFGLGNVILDTADRSHPLLIIPAQPEVDALKGWIHQVNVAERERLGYREFENTSSL